MLVMTAAKVRAILTIPAAATMPPPAPMHAEPILTAVALVVTVLPGRLLRLWTAAGDESRQAADVLSALVAALVWLLLIRLLLMLWTVLHLLITWRERLGIARQVWLLLRFTRSVARLVLAHERLGVVVVAVKSLVGVLLGGRLLLRLLVVIRVLLTE